MTAMSPTAVPLRVVPSGSVTATYGAISPPYSVTLNVPPDLARPPSGSACFPMHTLPCGEPGQPGPFAGEGPATTDEPPTGPAFHVARGCPPARLTLSKTAVARVSS